MPSAGHKPDQASANTPLTRRTIAAADIEALVAQSQKRSAVFDIVTNPTNVKVTVA